MKREEVIILLRARLAYVNDSDVYGVGQSTWLKAPVEQRQEIFNLCGEFYKVCKAGGEPTWYWESVAHLLKILEKSK